MRDDRLPYDPRRAKRARLILDAMRDAPAATATLIRAGRCPGETRNGARGHTWRTIEILRDAGCLVRDPLGHWLITPAGLCALTEHDAFVAAPAAPAQALPIWTIAA